jgi:hypothetical protein
MDAGSMFVGAAGIIAALSAAVSPWYLLRAKRQEKLDDWDRQDKVADRLLKAADVAREAAEDVARVAADNFKETNGQLKQIHTLVNSEKTGYLTAELNLTLALIAQIEMPKKEPMDDQDHSRIAPLRARVDELKAILADREIQTKIGEDELKKSERGGYSH